MALIKPMLAAKPKQKPGERLDDVIERVIDSLTYPVLGSPKLDGIRCTVQGGKLYSRSLKLIPNKSMQKRWGRKELNGLDGEIVVGPETAPDVFQRTTSCVMSAKADDAEEALAKFRVFDDLELRRYDFSLRFYGLEKRALAEGIVIVAHKLIQNAAVMRAFEQQHLHQGYEGVMSRALGGEYKQGRSTLNEEWLVALKRFVDAEGVIVSVYEQKTNTNAAYIDERGNTKRSSAKAGKVGKDTLGGFEVRLLDDKGKPTETVHRVGTGVGLTTERRLALWAQRKALVGKIVKFKYQAVGTKVAPREPIFLGFRDKGDM